MAKEPSSWLRALILLGLLTVEGSGVMAGTPSEPKVSLEPATARVVLGQPVIVDLVLKNNTQREWVATLGGTASNNVRLTVKKDDNLEIQRQVKNESVGENVIFGGPVELAPGAEFRRTLVLNSWYDFDGVGEYLVTIEIPVSQEESRIEEFLKQNITVHVEPSDLETLGAACSGLADQAIGGTSERAHYAGEALSHVTHEVCLPSLRRVLEESFFAKYEAVVGLAEVGSEKAIAVLTSSWGDLTPGLRARALWEFEQRSRRKDLELALEQAGLLRDQDRTKGSSQGKEPKHEPRWDHRYTALCDPPYLQYPI